MAEQAWLADRFEDHRPHLKAVAYRMLGSAGEVDDAVQEAWLRLSRSSADQIENLRGWLTTVVARVCLDMLRARRSRREDALDPTALDSSTMAGAATPEGEALLAESLSHALLIVLDTLAPAERVAFVLHDMFAVPFEDIAPILGRSIEASRQLASRGRRRVQGGAAEPDVDRVRQRELVDAFLAAARNADFAALLAVLDPDIVLRADEAAVRISQATQHVAGALHLKPEIRGAQAVAETFLGRAAAARPVLVKGAVGAAWAPGGTPRSLFTFTFADGKIVALDLMADPDRLRTLDLEFLSD